MARKQKNILNYWSSEEELAAHVTDLKDDPLFKYWGVQHIRAAVEFDPEYADRFRETHRRVEAERIQSELEIQAAQAPLWAELAALGLLEYSEASPEGWITPENVDSAYPILIKWFPHINNSYAQNRLLGTLNSPAAANWVPTLMEFLREFGPKFPERNFGEIDAAIGTYLGHEHLEEAIGIVIDSELGWHRSGIVHNLWRFFDDPRVEPTILQLMDQPDCLAVERGALYVLRRVGKPSYRSIFEGYLDHDDSGMRRLAREGIEKVDKAVARAEGRTIPKKVVKKREPQNPRPWPSGLPHDALVTLIFADLLKLDTLSGMSRAELLGMRGVGPKAIERIELELKAKDFAPLTD